MKMAIPAHVQYFMTNYNEGYDYGYRDGNKKNPHVTNFSQEKHGFMTGYAQGYAASLDKKGGTTASSIFLADFMRKIDMLEILVEVDKSGSDSDEQKEFRKRYENRVKAKKIRDAA